MEKSDLRIIKTLRQIDVSLLENLAACPFRKITINMICDRAMINRSTFYKYYLDKYDLLDKYLNRTMEEFRQHINVEFINAEPSRIHDICYINNFDATLEFIEKNKDKYEILWTASTDRRIYDEMTGIIRDSIITAMKSSSEQTPHQKKCASLYAFIFASNMMSLIQWWFQYYTTVTRQEVETIMTDNMHFGLFKTFKNQTEKS